ncbi:fumarate hydratase [candidate division WOR_3 bacterium SM1_77]|jgi:fumarate hydratase subunit alpha|uniref:Fumarate hydratase n=1 Tax=candidate division WOR_3 bacterium SM1_77 TaxID=1703778 RepID=A0A0S8K0Y5_UNCW3|nr:MAG: fumarate hydratase [candidate division WOR_3 bacterium SM1_77]
MREVSYDRIVSTVTQLCMDANYFIGEDMIEAFKKGLEKEESETGKDILKQLLKNAEIAKSEKVPLCQDCGFAVVFLELGTEVHVSGSIIEAINDGVRKGYTDGFLRKSILSDPVKGKNTGDNTPAIVHTKLVPGDKIKITVAPKGGGSENMSEVKMMKPADGIEGVKSFVVDRVVRSSSNPCPPIVVGVGIGGTFEYVAFLAKKALLRDIGERNPDPFYADIERELLEKINNLGIGPQGLGGRITALDVFIETHPRHIASFPVAVNINCHVARHKVAII